MSIASAFRPSYRSAFLAGLAIIATTTTLGTVPAHAESARLIAGPQSTSVIGDPHTAVDQEFLEVIQSVRSGESLKYRIDGASLRLSNVDGTLHVDADGPSPYGLCAMTVATGLVLLGAAALATLAFATAGAGGAIIAGHVFTTAQIWGAAGVVGAWGALMVWVENHIC